MLEDEARARVGRFYYRYGPEIEQVRDLLVIQLRQLALAYTIENRLPQEAVAVQGRVKTQKSLIKKLERRGWPNFYFPTEVARDLIGARVVCWFRDDARGMVEFIQGSQHFRVIVSGELAIRDYIAEPQSAGYRAIHAFVDVTFDRVKREGGSVRVVPEQMLCEIQVRTKLQDAWADITHEFFYKAKDDGIEDKTYETFLADIAARLAQEDRTLMSFREVYRELADEKTRSGRRQGFTDHIEDD